MRQSDFKFKKPILKELSYKIKDDFDNNKNSINTSKSINSNIEVEQHIDKPIARVTLSCSIDSDGFPFLILISMFTEVKWIETTDNDMIDDVLRLNVPALLMSYIRPIVSQITSYSPFRAFDIPFINFLKNEDS